MAEQSIASVVTQAAGAAGGLGIGGVVAYYLAQLLRGWFSGAQGQEREVRDTLASRVGTLENRVSQLEASLSAMTDSYHAMRFQRDQARLQVNALQIKHREPVSTWPADPPPVPAAAPPAPNPSGGPP